MILLLAIQITVALGADRLLIHHDIPLGWVCILTEGKIDDKMNPGEFIGWFAESCWGPWLKREEYKLRPGTLRYRVCFGSDGLQCLDWKNIRPEEEPFVPIGPNNPPPGIRP